LKSQSKNDTKSATTERAGNIAQGSNAGLPDFRKLVADHRAYFRAYSNARGILMHSTKIDIGGLRYPPYDHNRILREIVMPS
jgi:hypothetical protein